MPANRSVPDVAEKRKAWNGIISGFSTNNLVFLDESGCNTDMTRRYAYAQGGSRAVDSAPLSKPKNTTILSSIQLDGSLHYTTFSGGTTVEKFNQYLVNDLLPYLNPDSVLVMDNMKSHHAKAIKQLLEKAKVRYIFLPPYSPDLNPIENLWSKVKALLRKFKARTLETLPDAIQRAFRAVTLSDCSGWFCACGYSR
jgi:transposase